MTSNSTSNGLLLELANTTNLDVQLPLNLNLDTPGLKFIKDNTSREGDFWEHYVGLIAWRKGIEVFDNKGRTGPVDLILDDQSNPKNPVIRCNVKAKVVRNKSYPERYYQETLNVLPPFIGDANRDIYMVCVHPVTGSVCWHTNRIPEGWEDFWK